MAGNGRFGTRALPFDSQQSLLQNSRSGLPKGLPSGLGSSHFLPGFRRRLPKGFPSSLGCSRLLLNFRRRLAKGFPSTLGSLTSSHTFEEEYPRAFLQASEVSHPPILPKKTTQGLSFKPWLFSHPPKLPKKSTRGLSFKPRVFSPPPILPKKTTRWPSSRPWKLSHPAWFSKKTTRGSDYSSSGGSRVLMMAFSNSVIPTAPRCIKGLPSIGMKRREGIERIPNRAASFCSSSTLTL